MNKNKFERQLFLNTQASIYIFNLIILILINLTFSF